MAKVSYIQIPNHVILNNKLSSEAFSLYAQLKYSSRNNLVNAYYITLIKAMNYSQNITLKKHLIELHKHGLIKENFEGHKFNMLKPLQIHLTTLLVIQPLMIVEQEQELTITDNTTVIDTDSTIEVIPIPNTKKKAEYFTQLPANILKNYKKLSPYEIRLLYYYESFINRKTDKSQAAVSLERIANETGLANKTVLKYNKILLDKKMISKVVHSSFGNFSATSLHISRHCNDYSVNIGLLENY